MRFVNCAIHEKCDLTEDLFILQIPFLERVQAGQFVMINIPDGSLILPRPISVFDYEEKTALLSLLIRKRGKGTSILSNLEKGDLIKIFGPCGKGFDTSLTNQKIFLMGGGEGISPMLLASNILKKKNVIKVLAGFRTKKDAIILDKFPSNLDISYVSQDSEGHLVTALLGDEIPDYIYACGPIPMLHAIHDFIFEKKWHSHLMISVENHMACGVGACMGCTIQDQKSGFLRICVEGPVFSAKDVFHV